MPFIFPDNKYREARAHELINDVTLFTNSIAKNKDYIESQLKNLNQTLQEISKLLPPGDSKKFNPIKVDGENYAFEVAEYASWLLTTVSITKALSTMITLWKASRRATVAGEEVTRALVGEVAEGVAEDGVEVSAVESVGLTIGRAVGGVIALVGLDLLLSGIDGSKERDILQKAIKVYFRSRVNLKYTTQDVDKIMKEHISENKSNLDKITNETAMKDLAELDSKRNSWTTEDN
ncbi:hypothetical protein F8M41_020299 [Gigaspora margarita]|uniref:Uncharacterized protein n=1 Tax=Gigaspora margarita TaxID=4874 RepID=A0A8H4AIQ2_GIGMA|nr:hypothetical protein F8M41_020299 [Gigaspora margarita]